MLCESNQEKKRLCELNETYTKKHVTWEYQEKEPSMRKQQEIEYVIWMQKEKTLTGSV